MAASGTLQERIAGGRLVLIRAGFPAEDAAIDADVLARHVLGWDRASLLARGRDPATAEFIRRFEGAIARRAAREPVALITGIREFWGLEFEVTRDVLIPRPETELIVEAALGALAEPPQRIADVGTGSGCLAVALAVEFPRSAVAAVDASAPALRVARRNAARHGVEQRISFVRADLLDAVAGPFDLIVSNPPYVPESDPLPPDVANYEPAGALFAGPDGLAVLSVLIPAALPLLTLGGALIVEFGFGQADRVQALARAAGWRHIDVKEDLQRIPRVAVMKR
jgi:release factor glutamine methyltransferase